MATQVPLKIRVDIRDLWDSPNSEVQTAIATLAKTLGHNITPIVQWPKLHDELKAYYPDNASFIPSISHIVTAWYERLQRRLDSGSFPDWTEELLELLSPAKKQLIIEPLQSSHTRPSTQWNARSSCFYLGIPTIEPLSLSRVAAGFDEDFESLLAQGDAKVTVAEEGWDDLASEPSGLTATSSAPKRTVTTHTINNTPSSEARAGINRLPTLAELPRPKDLFARRSPYVLTLDTGNPLVIRCSHEASLQLIQTYFDRWGRPHVHDALKRNIFKVELVESTLVSGIYDSVTIEPYSNFRTAGWQINPALIIAFIEGVLGYNLVHTNGQNWVFRSDTILN